LLLRDQRVCTGNIFALVLKEEGIKWSEKNMNWVWQGSVDE
jgi:hypothetical protein